jgi:hypothetical protein
MSGHQNNFSYNEFNGLVYQRNWNITLKSNIPIPPKGLEVRRPRLIRLMREMAASTSERLPYRWRFCQAIRPRAVISAA